jgi:hypothetical protein
MAKAKTKKAPAKAKKAPAPAVTLQSLVHSEIARLYEELDDLDTKRDEILEKIDALETVEHSLN